MAGFVGALREAPLHGICHGTGPLAQPIPCESREVRQ